MDLIQSDIHVLKAEAGKKYVKLREAAERADRQYAAPLSIACHGINMKWILEL
jgi:hypothetical protein